MTGNDVINTFAQSITTVGVGLIAFIFLCVFFVWLSSKITRKRTEWEPDLQRDIPLSPEEIKGRRGENFIAKVLYETVPGEFQVFRNVYVPNGDATTEIDLVMVHETGIFAFESKNYNGLISGSMDALNWAYIHPNRKKYLFYNPVRQNRTHIKALSKYLQIPENRFFSYIVFSKHCKLERVPESTRSVVITRAPELAAELQDMLSALPALYSAEEVRAISDRLAPLTNVDSAVKAKHIRDIRDAQESDTCPWCGGKLVTRRGKYGKFLGCSSYPRCKFKRNITR